MSAKSTDPVTTAKPRVTLQADLRAAVDNKKLYKKLRRSATV